MTEHIALWLIVWATLGGWAFVILYGTLAPWHRSREGRHMMALTVGLTALGTLSVLRRWIGEWGFYDESVMLTFALIGWELWRRVYLLLSAQNRGDDRD